MPGRQLPYGLSLTYNAQKWEQDTVGGYPVGRYTGGWIKSNVFGSAPTFYVQNFDYGGGDTYLCYVYWIDGAGTKHKYATTWNTPWCDSLYVFNGATAPWNGQTIKSMDSDGSTFWTGEYRTNGSDPARINFKNGDVLYFRTPTSPVPYDYVTPNGNYLVKSTDERGLPTQDTLGRSVSYVCSGCGGASWTETYTITDSNNQSQTYVLNWVKNSNYMGTTFLDPIWYPANTHAAQMTLLTSVILPNGKSYTFEYANVNGMLTKVTLPSGAYIRYGYYTDGHFGPAQEIISERRVSSDGTAGAEKVWQYSRYPWLVTSPEGDNVVHSFNEQGQETSTEWRSATNVVLKRIDNTWSQDYIADNGQPANPRTASSTTQSVVGFPTIFSTKGWTYDSTTGNLLQEDYGEGTGYTSSILKTRKNITYMTISGNYQVPTLETLTAIDPATGSFVSQGKTEYLYDEYPLTTRSGVPNHTGNTSKDNRGNITTIKRYQDATNFVPEHIKYDSVGNVVEKIDPLNHSTLIDFTDNFTDTTKNGSKFAYPKKVTNALGQFATSKYDFNTGLVKESTNLRNYTTATVYDLINRVQSITEPNGKQTTYSYDDTNRVTTKQVTVDTAGNKGQVKTYFDGLYRVVQTRTNDPEGEIWVDGYTTERVAKSRSPIHIV